jgi:zinc protease
VPSDGTPADLARITHDDLADFVRAHLARDNMVIGVVGDITPAELGPLLDRTFGALPAKAAPAAIAEIVPASGHGPEVITRDEPQSVIAFAGPGVKRDDPDFYAAYVLSHVLGSDSLTSRLGDAVRVKRGLVYTIYLSAVPFAASALEMGGFATRNEKVGEALKLVRQVLAAVREHGITAAELADAKTSINGSFPLTLSSNGRIAAFLAAIQLDRLGIDYLDRRAKLIDAVTLADVQRVARRLLDPDKLLVVVVGKPQGLGG